MGQAHLWLNIGPIKVPRPRPRGDFFTKHGHEESDFWGPGAVGSVAFSNFSGEGGPGPSRGVPGAQGTKLSI